MDIHEDELAEGGDVASAVHQSQQGPNPVDGAAVATDQGDSVLDGVEQTDGVAADPELQSALEPEPPTAEEHDMDRMFGNGDYPSVREIMEAPAPEPGLEFDSRDQAFFFFASYARRVGFAVKRDTTYESRVSKQINKQSFSCNRSRANACNDSALRKRMTSRINRTMCPVKIIVKEESGRWVIKSTNLEHNHELSPSEWLVRFMKCHKRMSESDKALIDILQESRVPPRKVMTIFRRMMGSFRGVPFDAKYLSNRNAKKRLKHKNKDIEELLKIFKSVEEKMPGFSYQLQVDAHNTVRSVFWTDQIGRANYSQFGQFVSFDTTYSTNQYNMPFAPVVGVDNYGKTVLFGAALLKDEKENTFRWLFRAFLRSMGGLHPETIITDQDVAMRNAIRAVMLHSTHRFCNWHIQRKMKQKLVPFFAARGTLHAELRSLIRNSFTPEEFESGWHALLEKHDAQDETHLKRLFEIRDEWVPAYDMDKFFPFTSSTGRSESTNSLFKGYVLRKDSIATFFNQYQIVQEKKHSDLDRLREKSELREQRYWSYDPMEREAAKIYTPPIYAKFVEEMKKTTAYRVEVVAAAGETRAFLVTRRGEYQDAEFSKRIYTVSISPDDVYRCSCSKFNRDGLHCCHVLAVARHIGLSSIPESFINPRWTVAAGHVLAMMTDGNVGQNGQRTHLTVRHSIVMS